MNPQALGTDNFRKELTSEKQRFLVDPINFLLSKKKDPINTGNQKYLSRVKDSWRDENRLKSRNYKSFRRASSLSLNAQENSQN